MNRLFLIGAVTLAATAAAAQTTSGTTGAGSTNAGMTHGSTGTIGALSGSSTEPSAGGSAPAGSGPTGAVSNDTTNGQVGTPPASSKRMKHKTQPTSQNRG